MTEDQGFETIEKNLLAIRGVVAVILKNNKITVRSDGRVSTDYIKTYITPPFIFEKHMAFEDLFEFRDFRNKWIGKHGITDIDYKKNYEVKVYFNAPCYATWCIKNSLPFLPPIPEEFRNDKFLVGKKWNAYPEKEQKMDFADINKKLLAIRGIIDVSVETTNRVINIVHDCRETFNKEEIKKLIPLSPDRLVMSEDTFAKEFRERWIGKHGITDIDYKKDENMVMVYGDFKSNPYFLPDEFIKDKFLVDINFEFFPEKKEKMDIYGIIRQLNEKFNKTISPFSATLDQKIMTYDIYVDKFNLEELEFIKNKTLGFPLIVIKNMNGDRMDGKEYIQKRIEKCNFALSKMDFIQELNVELMKDYDDNSNRFLSIADGINIDFLPFDLRKKYQEKCEKADYTLFINSVERLALLDNLQKELGSLYYNLFWTGNVREDRTSAHIYNHMADKWSDSQLIRTKGEIEKVGLKFEVVNCNNISLPFGEYIKNRIVANPLGKLTDKLNKGYNGNYLPFQLSGNTIYVEEKFAEEHKNKLIDWEKEVKEAKGTLLIKIVPYPGYKTIEGFIQTKLVVKLNTDFYCSDLRQELLHASPLTEMPNNPFHTFGKKIAINKQLASYFNLVELEQKIQKEGFEFVIDGYPANGFSTIENYIEANKLREKEKEMAQVRPSDPSKIQNLCVKLNQECLKNSFGKSEPFCLWFEHNTISVGKYWANDRNPDELILLKNKIEKEGGKFLIGNQLSSAQTVEEYIQERYKEAKAMLAKYEVVPTKEGIEEALTKYEVPPFSVYDFVNIFHNKYNEKFGITDIKYNNTNIYIRAKNFSPNNEYFKEIPNHVAVWWNGQLVKSWAFIKSSSKEIKEVQLSNDLRLTDTKDALKNMQVEEDAKLMETIGKEVNFPQCPEPAVEKCYMPTKEVKEDIDFEDFKKRWIGKNGIIKIEKVDDVVPQVKALIGQYGILDITNLDDPNGVIVKAEWFDHYFERDMSNFVHQKLEPLGLKIQDVKWSYVHGPMRELKNLFFSKIGKRITTSISAVILTALVGFNYDKIPTSLSPTVIHEGIVKDAISDEKNQKLVFADGSSFVLENDKFSGIIPKGTNVRLVRGVFGKYYFEKTGE